MYHFFQIRYARRYLVRVSIYVELNKYQKIFLPGDIDKDVLMQRLWADGQKPGLQYLSSLENFGGGGGAAGQLSST